MSGTGSKTPGAAHGSVERQTSAPSVQRRLVAIKSIGCRTNQEEMGALHDSLIGRGFAVVDDPAGAEIVIVNTCSVTSGTEAKTRRLLESIHREAPGARIMVTGCLAQQNPGDLLSRRGIHWVVGNGYKERIPEILDQASGGTFHGPLTAEAPLDCTHQYVLTQSGRTRRAVKIQEGCDFRCSYCIVPSLRGPSRSAASGLVLQSCRAAVMSGCKELVLTGTHIGQFQRGSGGSLEELLDKILRIPGDFRVRLSSLDPRDLSPRIIDLVGSNERVCDHLHLSLQSLAPDVLKGMGRPYAELDRTIGMLLELRKRNPRAGLGADFIVGFPGESRSMFERTMARAAEIAFSYAHVFRFSKRPGTPAATMSGQVSEAEKSARSDALRGLVARSRERFVAKLAGSTHRIIVESESPVRGLTSNYLHVEIPYCRAPWNSWLDVCIEGCHDGRYCRGMVSKERGEAA